MPRGRRKRGPLPGQLTLEQALSRAVRQRDLPETDTSEPEDSLSSSPDERDVEWKPPGGKRRRAILESSDGEINRAFSPSIILVHARPPHAPPHGCLTPILMIRCSVINLFIEIHLKREKENFSICLL